MKIIFTGAHFTPAVAVIEELKKQKAIEIIYVGRSSTLEGDSAKSVESQVLPELGVKFIPIIAGRIRRSFGILSLISLLKIPIGFIQAFFIILKEKPDLIMSFGGYVAVPIVFSGWLWSIPVIIHEQTLVSGLANRISAIFADKIFVGFKQNAFSKNSKTNFVGNPIRKEILNLPTQIDDEYKQIFAVAKKNRLPLILITGGNQGSHSINLSVEECLEKLLKTACVIHQTGDSKFQDFERLSQIKNERYLVKKWIGKEVGVVFQNADLLVSRSGANTLTEAAYFQKPVLTIPLPFIYQDEQTKNAKYFEKIGIVRILRQKELNGENLLKNIQEMLKHLDTYIKNSKAVEEVIVPDAAKRLALEIILHFKSNPFTNY